MILLNDCGIGFFSREDGYCMKCFKDDIIKCVYIIYAKDSETNQFGVYACSPEDSSF